MNNQSVTSPLVDKHASASEPPMHKTISAAPADSSESDTFVYPSITAPASQDMSDPIPATGSPHSTFPGDDLAADQHAACLQGGTLTPAKIPAAEAAEAAEAAQAGVCAGLTFSFDAHLGAEASWLNIFNQELKSSLWKWEHPVYRVRTGLLPSVGCFI